jgi:hypothetical protein
MTKSKLFPRSAVLGVRQLCICPLVQGLPSEILCTNYCSANNSSLSLYKWGSVDSKLITVITQFRVTTQTPRCMNVSYTDLV